MNTDDEIAALRSELAEVKRELERTSRLHDAGSVAAIRALGLLRNALYLIDSRMPTVGGLGDDKRILVDEISAALRQVEETVLEVENARQ
jgi:hypothetical protein